MKRISTLDVAAVGSCKKMHMHGTFVARFTFKKDNPLVIRMKALQHVVDLSRETFDLAIRDGHMNGCNVIGQADVTFKVPRSMPELLCISWVAPLEDRTEDSDRYYILVSRTEVYPWLRDTYAQVPRYAEFDALDIDGVIKQIMEASK